MSHIVVLRPYSYGYKTSTAAKVTYKHSESDDQVQVSFSNDLGPLPVLSSKDDDKLAAPHMVSALFFPLARCGFVAREICAEIRAVGETAKAGSPPNPRWPRESQGAHHESQPEPRYRAENRQVRQKREKLLTGIRFTRAI